MDSNQIFNLYRALFSYRQITTHWHGQTIKFLDIEILDSYESIDKSRPGNVCFSKKYRQLIVVCSNLTLISVKNLQVEGKRTISALDFNNGFMKKRPKNEHYFE